MLTPQEVQDKKFEKVMFGGYDMASIDAFLETVTEDYTALYKDNATLKGKLKVLVGNVEEYRSVDDAMRKALLSAEKIAQDKINEAKTEAETILNKARGEAENLAVRVRAENESELHRQKILREQTQLLISRITQLYEEHLALIKSTPELVFGSVSESATGENSADALSRAHPREGWGGSVENYSKQGQD